MQESNSQVAYEYNLVNSTYPRGSERSIPITNTCNRPSKVVTIDMYTNCMLCVCDGWLPIPVGEITDFQKLEDIWNNPIARDIQKDVADKKFTNCAVEHCGIIHRSNIEPKYHLTFGIDDSCNFYCPSCRRDQRMHSSGPLYEKKLKAVEHTVKLLSEFEHPIHITLACSGDPLASHIYRPLLHSYQAKDTQTFTLFTNGSLLKKQLNKTNILKRITKYFISVDAGSPEVYHQIRLGGSWPILMENFEFLKNNKGSANVSLLFVIQQKNYKDIFNYIDLCNSFGFTGGLSHLDDWGTWNREPVKYPDDWTKIHGTFVEHNVLDPIHPNYLECREIIKEVRKNHPRINITPRVLAQLKL